MKVLCTLSLGHKSTDLKLYEESFEKYLLWKQAVFNNSCLVKSWKFFEKLILS